MRVIKKTLLRKITELKGKETKLHNEDVRNLTPIQLLLDKCTAVPLQVWSGPEGSRKLRFPDFMTTGTGWW